MLTILDFWAPWCGNCKAFAPAVEEAAKEANVKLIKVDASKDLTACDHYGIMNLPTLVILKDDAEVGRVTGVISKKDLLDKLQSFL